MGKLIPFDFASLGVAEFVWLYLLGAGLSFAASRMGWRRRFAAGAAVLCFLLALVRLPFVPEEASAWVRWVGPVLFTPVYVAAMVMTGMLRGSRVNVWMVAGAAVVWTVAMAPFGSRVPDPYLALIYLAFIAFLEEDGRWRALLLRKFIGPVRGWMLHAAVFVAYCALVQPHGVGFVGAIGHLFLAWVLYAMFEQGEEMQSYVTRRLKGAPIVMFIILILSFAMMKAAPGGPFDKEKSIDPTLEEKRNKKLGLDQPWYVQFRKYLTQVVWEGDLGESYKQKGRPVNDIIADHIVPTAQLGLAAIVLAIAVGTLAGVISGIRQNSIFDYASMSIAMIGLALPTFVVGPFLVLLFAIKLQWFGFRIAGWDEFPRDLILPAITLALPFAARIARLTRAGMLEIINQDYVRTARAKGLDEKTIVLRHTLKGAMLPVVSFLGPAVAQLLTGSLVVEKIFGIPGLGTEFVNGAFNRDYMVAMGLVLLFGTLLILFNLIVDVAYGFLDPRIRHA
ncbi:MAG: ABC transporter permease [Planctomycetota bacterium]